MERPTPEQAPNHAIFGSLEKPGCIERYNVYRSVEQQPLEDTIQSNKNEDDDDNVDDTKSVEKKKIIANHQVTKKEEDTKEEILVADIRLGKNLDGHDGIMHGGIISLLFDESFGWGYGAMGAKIGKTWGEDGFPLVVTANLNVNYKKPLRSGKGNDIIIRVFHDKTVGRKVFVSARMESHDGSTLFSEATVLFITIPNERLLNKK